MTRKTDALFNPVGGFFTAVPDPGKARRACCGCRSGQQEQED